MDRHLAIFRACTLTPHTHTHTHTGNESLISYSLYTPWPVLPDARVSSFCNLSSAHASLLACVLSAALSQWMLYGWLQSYWLHDPGWHLSYWPARWNISTSLEPVRSISRNIHICMDQKNFTQIFVQNMSKNVVDVLYLAILRLPDTQNIFQQH
jgi:hypothetical protein